MFIRGGQLLTSLAALQYRCRLAPLSAPLQRRQAVAVPRRRRARRRRQQQPAHLGPPRSGSLVKRRLAVCVLQRCVGSVL